MSPKILSSLKCITLAAVALLAWKYGLFSAIGNFIFRAFRAEF